MKQKVGKGVGEGMPHNNVVSRYEKYNRQGEKKKEGKSMLQITSAYHVTQPLD